MYSKACYDETPVTNKEMIKAAFLFLLIDVYPVSHYCPESFFAQVLSG